MGHRRTNRAPGIRIVIVALLVALLPATALSDHWDGDLIQTTVFEHEVQQQTTEETVREFAGATLDGQPIAELPDPDETPQDFAARVGAGACRYVLVDTELESIPGQSTFDFKTDVRVEYDGELIDVTGLTDEQRHDVGVNNPDAVLIVGDPNGDPSSWTVLQGTVEVITTETTIETQHTTEITTETYNAECFTGYQACLYAGSLSQVGILDGRSLNCGRGTPIVLGAGDDFHACLYAGSLSQFGATEPKNCGRGAPIGLAEDGGLHACHYKGALSQVSTTKAPTNCGRGAPVELAGGLARR